MTEAFSIVLGEESMVDELFALLCKLDQEIGDPNYFVSDDQDYVENHIRAQGFTLAAMSSDSIVAGFLIVDIPGLEEKNLGYDLGWPHEKLQRCVLMDTVGVLPKYRGQGLQKALLLEGEQRCAAKGYTYCLATVYPENKPSLQSFLRLGYKVGVTKEKYGGVLRHVLYKELSF